MQQKQRNTEYSFQQQQPWHAVCRSKWLRSAIPTVPNDPTLIPARNQTLLFSPLASMSKVSKPEYSVRGTTLLSGDASPDGLEIAFFPHFLPRDLISGPSRFEGAFDSNAGSICGTATLCLILTEWKPMLKSFVACRTLHEVVVDLDNKRTWITKRVRFDCQTSSTLRSSINIPGHELSVMFRPHCDPPSLTLSSPRARSGRFL